ncbi:MAG: hypothetical protein CML18_01560 [Pusillimonas sp.]|nr:hypothetical protein [Pusillimonas sp.]|tara:strand:- start:61879 stop:62388 length:510 start_codon:yes stop_codon:yes gene_type:complete
MMNAIPTSREDQLQLSRDLIKQTVLKPNEHSAPPKIGISLWVPFYDAAHHKVRFLDVLKETWAKQGLRAFEGLVQDQSSDNDALIEINREPHTRFWLDTVTWLMQARNTLVLTPQELIDQINASVKEGCDEASARANEWLYRLGCLIENASEQEQFQPQSCSQRQVMRA